MDLDPTPANLDFLKAGDQLTITYAVHVGDSAPQNLVFTITGANDQTVLTSVNSTAVSTVVSELARRFLGAGYCRDPRIARFH